MDTHTARAATLGLVVAFAGLGISPLEAQRRPFDLERTKAVLTQLIEKTLKESGVPSISIALVRGDSIVWKAAFGYANVRTKTPATPATIYSAASTFKAVTATGLMQLAERGKLDIEHPIDRYLGDLALGDRQGGSKPVTFAHLLSHWSGLTTLPGRGEAEMKPIWSTEVPRDLRQTMSEMKAIRPPEAEFEYNNYAYGLAGLLLERSSGVSYEQYVVENILRPLGASTPHPVWPSPEMVELMALPYEVKDGRAQPVAQVHIDAIAAGAAYVTAEDMARFLGAHLNGGVFQGQRILSPSSVRQMHTPRFGGNYGLGFRVRKSNAGNTMIRHTGRIPGMRSVLLGDVDARVGVYYMANAMDVSMEIAEVAIALLRGEDYPIRERRAIAVDPKVLARYAGAYEMEGDVFNVTLKDGKLHLDKNGKKQFEFLAETPTRFYVPIDPSTVEFEEGPSGAIERMVVTDMDWVQKTATRRK